MKASEKRLSEGTRYFQICVKKAWSIKPRSLTSVFYLLLNLWKSHICVPNPNNKRLNMVPHLVRHPDFFPHSALRHCKPAHVFYVLIFYVEYIEFTCHEMCFLKKCHCHTPNTLDTNCFHVPPACQTPCKQAWEAWEWHKTFKTLLRITEMCNVSFFFLGHRFSPVTVSVRLRWCHSCFKHVFLQFVVCAAWAAWRICMSTHTDTWRRTEAHGGFYS